MFVVGRVVDEEFENDVSDEVVVGRVMEFVESHLLDLGHTDFDEG